MARHGLHAVDSLRGIYVLVADGDEAERAFLRTILRYCGAYVREAASAEEALELMRTMLPDVLVLVLGDAGERGFWMIRQLRGLKPDAGGMVRLIAVGVRAAEERSRALGVDGYLVKPFDPWELCRLVASLTTD